MTKNSLKIERRLQAANIPLNGVAIRNSSVEILREEGDTDQVAELVMQTLGWAGVKESWGGWVVTEPRGVAI